MNNPQALGQQLGLKERQRPDWMCVCAYVCCERGRGRFRPWRQSHGYQHVVHRRRETKQGFLDGSGMDIGSVSRKPCIRHWVFSASSWPPEGSGLSGDEVKFAFREDSICSHPFCQVGAPQAAWLALPTSPHLLAPRSPLAWGLPEQATPSPFSSSLSHLCPPPSSQTVLRKEPMYTPSPSKAPGL